MSGLVRRPAVRISASAWGISYLSARTSRLDRSICSIAASRVIPSSGPSSRTSDDEPPEGVVTRDFTARQRRRQAHGGKSTGPRQDLVRPGPGDAARSSPAADQSRFRRQHARLQGSGPWPQAGLGGAGDRTEVRELEQGSSRRSAGIGSLGQTGRRGPGHGRADDQQGQAAGGTAIRSDSHRPPFGSPRRTIGAVTLKSDRVVWCRTIRVFRQFAICRPGQL